MQAFRIAQGVIAADGNHCVDAEMGQVGQDMPGKIVLAFRGRVIIGSAKELRHILIVHLCRVCPAGMEKGAAGAVHRPHRISIQMHNILFHRMRIGLVVVEQSTPAAANAKHPVTLVNGMVDQGLEGRIKARHIATAGQYTYGFLFMRHC